MIDLPIRNVEVPDGAPLTEWPYEALVALIERGSIRHWALLSGEIRRDPWGTVARQIEEYLGYESCVGVGPLLDRAIHRARRDAERREREAVAAEVAELIVQSGLSAADFARRIGTSRSRLSTYRSGKVTPAATLMHRMRELLDRL